MGCIERVPETSVVRLGYEGEVATARELKAEQLTERALKPLLRSTNVLRALFMDWGRTRSTNWFFLFVRLASQPPSSSTSMSWAVAAHRGQQGQNRWLRMAFQLTPDHSFPMSARGSPRCLTGCRWMLTDRQ
jgi:hypothetical protein